MLLVGSAVMAISMIIVGIIVAKDRHDWPHYATAGWVAVGMSQSYPDLAAVIDFSNSLHLGLHRRLWSNLGTRFLDANLRDLPALNPRQGSIHRCFKQLDQQLCDCIFCAPDVQSMGMGNVHLLCGLPYYWNFMGLVLPARDEEQDFGGDGQGVWQP